MSAWENREPAELQIGNGKLLATFDRMGEIEQLYSPHIDNTQSRFGAYRTIVLVMPEGETGPDTQPKMIPLTEDQFEVNIRLTNGTQVMQAEYQYKHGPLRITRRLGMHPTEPVILDSWQMAQSRAGLLHQSVPWIGHATSAHCSMFHPTFNGLVHHRGRRWMGVLAKAHTEWARVGHLSDDDRRRMWDGERIFAPVGEGDLRGFPSGSVPIGWDNVVQGPATWGALATGPSETLEFLVICAESEKNLGELLGHTKNVDTNRFFQMIEGMTARRLAPAQDILDRIKNTKIRALAERSIDVLHALQDAGSGALMAAAEVDPHSRMSGGYGYSWPRDGAYLAMALGAFNFRERVEHYFKFLEETQDVSGTWWQRYLATGHAGPSWGRIQIDEPATVVGAAYMQFRRTQDLFWLEKIWPSLQRCLTFLEGFHGPDHPLGLPSHDLWEERMGIHAYSLGAVAAAFGAGSALAGELSHRDLQARYAEWGTTLSKVVADKFVPSGGQISRCFVINAWDYQKAGGYWDGAADVSMLGLITPFGIFRKRDEAAQRILESVRSKLWNEKVGGIMRYERDTYKGGNPWILTTLWLGMVELSLNNHKQARDCFQWVVSKATAQGLLAEQVHRDTGKANWVIPLAWSHAMFLLFVRDVLDRHAEAEIWDGL